MSILETFLVNGTDLHNYGAGITDWSSAFETAPRRGSNYVVPGVNGELYVAKPLAASAIPIGMIVLPVDPATGVMAVGDQAQAAQMIANWRSIVSLTAAETGGTVTLTRKLSTVAGGSTTETCTAECTGGITSVPQSHGVMRIVINFTNLSGKWA